MKCQKPDPVRWLTNVIYLLQEGELALSELYSMTNASPSALCESLLYEHPSLVCERGVVSWRPTLCLSNQRDLLDHFANVYPLAVRRIDLRGLYAFVDVDLDELIFQAKIEVVDKRQDSMALVWRLQPLPRDLAILLRRVAFPETSHNLVATSDQVERRSA
jgi:hypothetical protein